MVWCYKYNQLTKLQIIIPLNAGLLFLIWEIYTLSDWVADDEAYKLKKMSCAISDFEMCNAKPKVAHNFLNMKLSGHRCII
jgi:hypothetical protein